MEMYVSVHESGIRVEIVRISDIPMKLHVKQQVLVVTHNILTNLAVKKRMVLGNQWTLGHGINAVAEYVKCRLWVMVVQKTQKGIW